MLRTRRVVCFSISTTFRIAHTHASFIEHNGSIWAVVSTATDHVISASADGTIALHASSTTSAIPEIQGHPSIQQTQTNPGARIWALHRQPLGFVGLSVAVSDLASEPAPEIARRALCNSMSGKTILVDFGSGEILGTKESLEKDPNTGVMPTEPGAILLNEHVSGLFLLNLPSNTSSMEHIIVARRENVCLHQRQLGERLHPRCHSRS